MELVSKSGAKRLRTELHPVLKTVGKHDGSKYPLPKLLHNVSKATTKSSCYTGFP
jgi:hypothetical protein